MGLVAQKRRKHKSLKMYGDYYSKKKEIIVGILEYYKNKDKKIAIWGAGLKGEALLMMIDNSSHYIDYVFDIDKNKYGKKMFSGHTITDYLYKENQDVEVVLIMNNVSENEVAYFLKEKGFQGVALNLDSIIEGELTSQEAIELYSKVKKMPSVDSEKANLSRKEIAAVVFLYHFDSTAIENIKSYAQDVNIVYAFDNSERKDAMLINELKQIPNVIYIDGEGNQGIAKAIAFSAKKAIESGHKWFFTFDQDSIAKDTMVETMINFIQSFTIEEREQLAIVCPMIQSSDEEFASGDGKYSYQSSVMQSGAMHNLEIYETLGGYDEGLFIYYVDLEYCFRARMKQYKIIKLNHAILLHDTRDEETIYVRKKGRKLVLNKYSEIAYYYITRNGLTCANKYKNENYLFYLPIVRRLGVLWRGLPYEKQKCKKLRAISYAILDYLFKRTGKCQWKI